MEAPIPDANNICRTCAEIDPTKPYWDGFQCLSCSEDLGGKFLDDIRCVRSCPESFVVEAGNKICKKCADIDPTKPLWQDGKCQACPEGMYFFDSMCAESCPTCCFHYHECTYDTSSSYYCPDPEQIKYQKPLFG